MPRIYIVVPLLPNMCCGDREKNVRTVCLLTNLATAKTLGDDVKTPRLTTVCKLETNVTLWESVVEARVYLIIYVTDVIFFGGNNVFIFSSTWVCRCRRSVTTDSEPIPTRWLTTRLISEWWCPGLIPALHSLSPPANVKRFQLCI